ncbi:MAG: CPBP family intramembrane metalloprotease [Tannerella sp.]|jgi:membrane protease YdiL (CAAX protease family)|nr:CPBP family intramembrane metalloprotease [Tannerella sp.]
MGTKNFLERAFDGQNQWWKYLVVFMVALFAAQFIAAIPLVILILGKIAANGGLEENNLESMADIVALGLPKNLVFGLAMLGPLATLIFTVILVKALHGRTFAAMVNGTKSVRWNRAFFAFAMWFALMAVYMGMDYFLHPDNYVLQFDPGKFAVLFLLSVVLIPIQTTSEELLMRGYLAQGIGAGTRSRWWALMIPTAIFGLLHIMNPEVAKFGFLLSMSQYFFFGFLFGLIAILDDGIELPMGLHAANNLFLSLFATHADSTFQTEALFSLKIIDPVQDLISLVAIGLVAFFILYRKYGWNIKVMNEKVGTATVDSREISTVIAG